MTETPGNGITIKTRLDMRIDPELKDFIKEYARRHHTTVTDLVTNYFTFLRKQEEESEKLDEAVEQI